MSEEVSQQFYIEAAQQYEAFWLGLRTWQEVIAWADEWINKLECAPTPLLEVSLSGVQASHGAEQLGKLVHYRYNNSVLSYLKQLLRAKHVSGELNAWQITTQISRILGGILTLDSNDFAEVSDFVHFVNATEVSKQWVSSTPKQKTEALQRLDRDVKAWLNVYYSPQRKYSSQKAWRVKTEQQLTSLNSLNARMTTYLQCRFL